MIEPTILKKEIVLVIPDPHNKNNKEQALGITTSFINALFFSEKIAFVIISVDSNDKAESLVREAIALVLSELAINSEELILFADQLRDGDNIKETILVDNLLINVFDKKLDIKKHQQENIEEYQQAKKVMLIVADEDKDFYIKNINKTTVSLNIISDCELAFKKLTRRYDYLLFIKQPEYANNTCYTSALKKTLNLESPIFNIVNVVHPDYTEALSYEKDKRTIKIACESVIDNINLMIRIIETAVFGQKIYISYRNINDVLIKYCYPIQDHLEKILPFVDVEIDKDESRYGKSLNKYMNQLKNGNTVIALIEHDYLLCENTMQEIIGVLENKRTKSLSDDEIKGLYPIIFPSANHIFKTNHEENLAILNFWRNKTCNFSKTVENNFESVIDLLRDCYNFPVEQHAENNFKILSFAIYERIKILNYFDIYNIDVASKDKVKYATFLEKTTL